MIPQLVFATSNENKKKEVSDLLNSKYKIISLADLNYTVDIPEPFDTLEENSQHKAEFLYKELKIPCFAEDTGLEVAALKNEPGVKSARYAGEQRSNDDNINLLLKNLSQFNDKSAQFRTVLTYFNGVKMEQFVGVIKGEIIHKKRGEGGFGYDPIFIPDGYHITFAEMDKSIKNKISHRGQAILKLINYLQNSK